MTGTPKWFDWPHWGLALGSDLRYAPKWYEKRAYVMGLRDAARIAEAQHWIRTETGRSVRRPGVRPVVKAIHTYTRKFLGLSPDDRSGLE